MSPYNLAFTVLFGVALGAGAAFAVLEILRLRRELKTAQKTVEAQEVVIQRHEDALFYVGGKPASEPNRPEPVPQFSGIGPTDIRNREMYERQKAEKDTRPPMVTPTADEIKSAAREATNGGRR